MTSLKSVGESWSVGSPDPEEILFGDLGSQNQLLCRVVQACWLIQKWKQSQLNIMLKSDEVGQKAKVLFDYASLAPNQISLKAGEIITVVNYGGKGSWSKGKESATGGPSLP